MALKFHAQARIIEHSAARPAGREPVEPDTTPAIRAEDITPPTDMGRWILRARIADREAGE
jgi:hypothetical protein